MGFTHYLVTRYCEDLRKQIKSLACVFYIPVKQHHSLFNSKNSYETPDFHNRFNTSRADCLRTRHHSEKDATEIQAKVLKITDTEIEFQRWDNPDGPIYTIPAEEVFTITYQNGSKEVISHFDSSRRSAADKQRFGKLPRYQGEFAFAYGLAVSEGMGDLVPRIVFETVHGVRINPYLFAGVGLGINYFYKDLYFFDGWDIYELGNSGTVLPIFANVKGYLPVSRKVALNLSWDLGAAIGIGGYFNGGTEFYTSVGPGVTFGRQSGGVRGDFSIRFQHMGEGLNAILFRIGIGF